MQEVIAGDTINLSGTLYSDIDNDVVYNIPTDGTITLTAFITDRRRNKTIVPAVQIAKTDPGNDWDNGIFKLKFTPENSQSLKAYDGDIVYLALRVKSNTDQTTFKRKLKAIKMP